MAAKHAELIWKEEAYENGRLHERKRIWKLCDSVSVVGEEIALPGGEIGPIDFRLVMRGGKDHVRVELRRGQLEELVAGACELIENFEELRRCEPVSEEEREKRVAELAKQLGLDA